jgi:hypothetical protein
MTRCAGRPTTSDREEASGCSAPPTLEKLHPLKVSQDCLEAIDYLARSELVKVLIRQLATGRWIAEHLHGAHQ